MTAMAGRRQAYLPLVKIHKFSKELQERGVKNVEIKHLEHFTRPFVGVVSSFVGTEPRHRAGLAG